MHACIGLCWELDPFSFFPYLSPSPSHISWAVPSLFPPLLSLKWAQPGLGLLCRCGSMDGERGARRARGYVPPPPPPPPCPFMCGWMLCVLCGGAHPRSAVGWVAHPRATTLSLRLNFTFVGHVGLKSGGTFLLSNISESSLSLQPADGV